MVTAGMYLWACVAYYYGSDNEIPYISCSGYWNKTYSHSLFGSLSANYGSTDYNWSGMPAKATAPIQHWPP
ncbi:MAG: hypothetical protein HC905_26700 [Bacteroidales bacterium]|nr:hypothetical protein [Bacteroidales bacterium]